MLPGAFVLFLIVPVLHASECFGNDSVISQGTLKVKPRRLYIQRNGLKEFRVGAKFNVQKTLDQAFEVSFTLEKINSSSSEENYALTISPNKTKLHLAKCSCEADKLSIAVQAHNITGRTIFVASGERLESDRVSIMVYKSQTLNIFTDIIGWGYFVIWSISFYPQIYMNLKRKSVVGLNFDFLALNILGFLCMSVFNVGLYFVAQVQNIYFDQNPEETELPLALNDVVFSLHALLACLITAFQCAIYERKKQRVSKTGILLIVLLCLIPIIAMIVWGAGKTNIIQVLYLFSYVKLVITAIKYIPQAFFNYRRKSTVGWSIGNILLDITGSILSLLQQALMAYNFDSIEIVFGNPVKFGLALLSMGFDCLFMAQHYCLYPASRENERIPETDLSSQDKESDSEESKADSSIA